MQSAIRGIYSHEEETEPTFKNGVPVFDSVDECMEWATKESQVGSNPNDPNLKQCFTHITDRGQLEQLVMSKLFELHKRENFQLDANNVDLSDNRFQDCQPIQHELDIRLSVPHHSRLSLESSLNTLNYLFYHLRCGIFVAIRNNKLVSFIPFVNKDFVNNWNNNLKVEKNLDAYYREKRKFYRKENILQMHQWWANGNIICNEHTAPREVTQWWGDNMLLPYKHMLEALCKERKLPDVDFFFNKRDHPQLKANVTEPYDFIFDEKDVTLSRCNYSVFTPIVSFYCSKRFSDLPGPTVEDWEGAVGKVFPPSFIPHTMKGKTSLNTPRDLYLEENFRKFKVEWKDKVNTAFFRGSATGGGVTTTTNQRLHIAQLSFEWNKNEDNTVPLLNAGVNRFNKRDKKLFGRPMTFLRDNTLEFKKADYVPLYKQGTFKYLLYIEGHCAANRYSFMMRLGSVILKVDSTCEASELWFFPLLEAWDENEEVKSGGADHVRVKADLSDLREKIEWCRDNDDVCKLIAANAQQKYNKYICRDAILDYMQLNLVKIAKQFCQPPTWYERPFEPPNPVCLRVGPNQFCAFDRKMDAKVLCKRCRERMQKKRKRNYY